MKYTWFFLAVGGLVFTKAWAVEDDYEFQLPGKCGGKSETGEDDAFAALAEGFEGLTAEPSIDSMIEPIDGAGGFANVAPNLDLEDGPGGLKWDPSPSYRTRYKGGTDYLAGASHLQGNNWFNGIPYYTYDSGTNTYYVRFTANTFRKYSPVSNYWVGQLGNLNSKMTDGGSGTRLLYDTKGKKFVFSMGFRRK